MKRRRRNRLVAGILVGLSAVFILSLALAARTLYVAKSGSDALDGSLDRPWQTIQHAIQQALPSDTILVAGGIYNEHIQSVRNGQEGAPIVLANLNQDTVVIDGTLVDWSTGISLSHDFIQLEGIEVRNWSSTGIWLDGAGHVTLRDCVVYDCVFGIGAGNGAHDFLLERVEIHDFDLYGFDASPSGGGDCYNGTFVDCIAHSSRDKEQNVDGFALGHGGQRGFRFLRCETYGVFDGFDISAQGTVLEDCTSHENANAGFKIWADDVSLVNCLAFANGICHVELDWDGEPGTTTLRHCTFVDAYVYSIWIENSEDRLDMVNCIVAGGDNIGLAFEQLGSSNYSGDFNLFHNDNAERAISVGYVDEFSLSDLRSGSWSHYSGQDAHSVFVADMSTIFRAPDAFDYRLAAGSPAIDAGLDRLAPETDIRGASRHLGAATDIGAFEFDD